MELAVFAVLVALFMAWAAFTVHRLLRMLTDTLKQLHVMHEEGAHRLIILAQEALTVVKAGSLEQKVAADMHVQRARIENEQLKEELRRHAPDQVITLDNPKRVIKATSPTGEDVEVNLEEYEILT